MAGETISEPVRPRTIVYPVYNRDRDRALWLVDIDEELYPDTYDYYLVFDYTISAEYTRGEFALHINNQNLYNRYQDFEGNGYIQHMGTRLVGAELEGNSGSVEIRMNDTEWGFWFAESNYTATYVYRKDKGFGYKKGVNYLLPIVYVYDEAGNGYTLNFLDFTKTYPKTEEDLESLSGYLTNFRVEKRGK